MNLFFHNIRLPIPAVITLFLLFKIDVICKEYTVSLSDLQLAKIIKKQQEFFSDSILRVSNENEMTRKAQDIIASYEKHINHNPSDTNARILYGKYLRRVGQEDHAIELFIEADKINPRLAVVKQQIANYLVEQGRPVEAFPYFILTIELEPKEAVYHFHLGNFLFLFENELIHHGILAKNSAQSFMHLSFKEASLLNPENFDFRLRYAQSFFDYKDSNKTKSLEVWENIEKNFPKITKIEKEYLKLCRAKTLLELNRQNDAVTLLKSVSSESLIEVKKSILQKSLENKKNLQNKLIENQINEKQSSFVPSYKHFLPDDPQLERLKKLTHRLVEERMLSELKVDAVKAKYNQSGKIQIELTNLP